MLNAADVEMSNSKTKIGDNPTTWQARVRADGGIVLVDDRMPMVMGQAKYDDLYEELDADRAAAQEARMAPVEKPAVPTE